MINGLTSDIDLEILFDKYNIKLNDVCCKDQINRKFINDGYYIVNLQDSNQNGSHWCCLYKKKNYYYWFDSYGCEPPQEILQISKNINYNKHIIQDLQSSCCGYYCLLFCYYIQKKKDINDFHKLFNNDYKDNDYKLMKYLKIKDINHIDNNIDNSIEGEGILDLINRVLYNKYDYTNSVKQLLNLYGNERIIKIQIQRKPINSIFNKILDSIHKSEYDKYFHLSLLCYIKDGFILIEKNENINMLYNPIIDGQIYSIGYLQNNLSINQMLNNTIKNIGVHNYYQYQALNNNCQDFLINILRSNNLLRDSESFIKQDVKYIYDNYKTLNFFMNKSTNIYSNFQTLIN